LARSGQVGDAALIIYSLHTSASRSERLETSEIDTVNGPTGAVDGHDYCVGGFTSSRWSLVLSHLGLSAILRSSVVQVYKPFAVDKHASTKDNTLLVYSIEEMRLQLWYSSGMIDLAG
jgi:hypothetical protein